LAAVLIKLGDVKCRLTRNKLALVPVFGPTSLSGINTTYAHGAPNTTNNSEILTTLTSFITMLLLLTCILAA
jgi:hypothetical protein